MCFIYVGNNRMKISPYKFYRVPRIGIFVEKYLSNGKEYINLIGKLF